MKVVRTYDFDGNIGRRFGVEAEFILPFNKKRWSIIIEPTYQSFTAEKSREPSNVVGGILGSNVDYTSIELPIGTRH